MAYLNARERRIETNIEDVVHAMRDSVRKNEPARCSMSSGVASAFVTGVREQTSRWSNLESVQWHGSAPARRGAPLIADGGTMERSRRSDERRPTLSQKTRCRPWTILAAAVGELGSRIQGAYLPVEIEVDLPDVHVESRALVEALLVLVDNALEAVGDARRVLVRVRTGRGVVFGKHHVGRRGDCRPARSELVVRFEVEDDGPGVPWELASRIGGPVFTTGAGAGHGLTRARRIVNENGGTIEVTSCRAPTIFAIVVPAL